MGKRLITIDDLVDVYSKARQRGGTFILSKLNWKGQSRTKSAFNESAEESSNWWMIPKVLERWNEKISGDPAVNYEQFMMEGMFKDRKDLKLISLGSGICSHEIELAQYPNFKEITCLDIAENRLEAARIEANSKGLNNIRFVCGSIYDFDFQPNEYDIVFFHASLHHFKNVEGLLKNTLLPTLKPKGHLVINEYVGPNRLQFPKEQIRAINEGLQIIPDPYRTRFKMQLKKHRFYGTGWIRMYLADPSECVDSESILPAIHKNMDVVIEKRYGGNLLMNILKDISHHFVVLNPVTLNVLNELFALEDEYIESNSSDFVFGIYEKR